MHPEVSDAALWALVRDGDEAAFAVVFDRYHPRVQRTVARQLGDVPRADVPAVAAEVFHTAWQRRTSVDVDTSVWPWLRAVATRLGANERRRCLRQDLLTVRTLTTGHAELVEPDHAALVAVQVAFTTALARLGTAEAEVAELAIVRDLSEAEVARRLGVPVGTVKSRLHRARRQLRRHLSAHLDPVGPGTPPATTAPRSAATSTSATPSGTAGAGSPRRRLDLWTPTTDGDAPLVVLVRGGEHESRRRRSTATKVRPLLDAGFAVAGVHLGSSGSPAGPPPSTTAAVDDVAAAVRHLTGLDGVDPGRVALWGESAGATVVCVLGALSGRPAPWDPTGDALPTVAAVVHWFGATGPGHDPASDDVPQPGPLPHLATADPAALPAFAIAHGDADDVVAAGESLRLADALETLGSTPWTTWLDGAGHGDLRFDAELTIPTIDWLQQVLEAR